MLNFGYKKLLDLGLAKEIARINLPLALYTEWYWQMDLHNLLHFLKLRLDNHAQYEIREYARVIKDIIRTVCPIAVDAFDNHVLNSKTFSKKEINAINEIIEGKDISLTAREKELFFKKLH